MRPVIRTRDAEAVAPPMLGLPPAESAADL